MKLAPRDPRLNPKMAARLAKAREEWESRPVHGNTRIFASFDDMLDSFASDCMRFSDIGRALDVSRERVRQLWRDYFASLFRNRSGRHRERSCTLARRADALRNADVNMLRGLASEAADEVTNRGMDAQPVLRTSHGSGVFAARRSLFINGRLVMVKKSMHPKITGPRQISGQFAFTASVATKKKMPEFVLARVGPPLDCWFIFPNAVFNHWNGATGRWRYIPARRTNYNGNERATGWVWQYQDAWHLLR